MREKIEGKTCKSLPLPPSFLCLAYPPSPKCWFPNAEATGAMCSEVAEVGEAEWSGFYSYTENITGQIKKYTENNGSQVFHYLRRDLQTWKWGN